MKGSWIIIVVAAGALAFPASQAAAHPGNWFWSRVSAESYILNRMTTSDDENIVDATCTGMGRPWRTRGRALWHHLRCDENDDVDREFIVTFHPTSRYHAVAIEISCDASYSEYDCP